MQQKLNKLRKVGDHKLQIVNKIFQHKILNKNRNHELTVENCWGIRMTNHNWVQPEKSRKIGKLFPQLLGAISVQTRYRRQTDPFTNTPNELDCLEDEQIWGHKHLTGILDTEILFECVAELLGVADELALSLLNH